MFSQGSSTVAVEVESGCERGVGQRFYERPEEGLWFVRGGEGETVMARTAMKHP